MSLATLNELAYDTWEPGLNNQLEHEPGALYSFLSRNSSGVRGRKVYVKLQTGRPTGVAQMDEGGNFPTAGDAVYDEVELALKRIAATVEFTLEEMDLLDGSDAAALPVVEHKLTDIVDTLRRDIVRQSWSDGTAKIGRMSGTSDSTTFTLQQTTTNQIDRDRNLWLEPYGMKIDLLHGTTGATSLTGLTVTGFNESTGVVTVSGGDPSSVDSSSHVVVRSGNGYASGGAYTSREFPGIMAAVDDGNTYLTLDRTTAGNEHWQSVVKDNSGTLRHMSLDLILQLINSVTRRTGMTPRKDRYCFFSNLGVWSSYGEYIQPGVRYSPNDMLDVGWPELEIFGMPFYGDIHAPNNNLFLIDKTKFSYRRPKYEDRGPFQFQNKDGSMFRYVPNASSGYKGKVQSNLTGMLTLITERPNCHGRLDDLNEAGA